MYNYVQQIWHQIRHVIETKNQLTVMKPYPLERPVSVSIMSCMCSIFPKGSKMLRSMSSVILKWREPTYKRMGPFGPLLKGVMAGILLPASLFFSAWVGWTTIGTPHNLWPVKAIAYIGGQKYRFSVDLAAHSSYEYMKRYPTKGTDSGSANST